MGGDDGAHDDAWPVTGAMVLVLEVLGSIPPHNPQASGHESCSNCCSATVYPKVLALVQSKLSHAAQTKPKRSRKVGSSAQAGTVIWLRSPFQLFSGRVVVWPEVLPPPQAQQFSAALTPFIVPNAAIGPHCGYHPWPSVPSIVQYP